LEQLCALDGEVAAVDAIISQPDIVPLAANG
jgi:hypothetical protein